MTVRRAVLAVLVPGAAVLVALHVSRIAERLRYPYDLILWGDDYFMTSMAKLAAGVPLYGPLADANSTVYAPGGAWLHHALLAPFHLDTSLHANRVLTLCWLTLALAVGTFTVSKLSRRRDGALESRVDESLSAALAFLVLALVALSNPVGDSLHPTDLELLVLSSSLAVLAAWRELSPGRRLVANVLLPAAAVLSKQTAGLAVTGALAAASFLDAEGPIARRLRASVV
ncbi:MAG TPA: hypothetical protein VHE30_03975, partial [Polyangiaceae bacterium]|nr:hypothetical protein [Polyangiaceae bacterium]